MISVCNFVKFKVFTAVTLKMAIFCVVAPCRLVDCLLGYRRFKGAIYSPEDGTSMHLRIIGKLLTQYTAQQIRRQPSSFVILVYYSI